MACKICKDLQQNEDVKAIYFDGTATSIRELQSLLTNTNKLNLNTLHTKIGWWLVKYKDGSFVWKRSKCFETGYKIIN